ncbi:glycoside hydrolase family 2 protein [Pseudosporangium ferrugineum]|uniref:Beta-galactosidase n=1 Tax=Pseudosporangium ferrugineum TaxID=439699 RepID=A0A2T0RX87_9ACTN|nr:glycoside hydrolase family 2 TIM barrel-domain containing protein [Pseudosporangium ferrugineum]PRY25805.1 beta-galactosidase [Pseudosporangium ferrugineum]
MSAPFFPVTAGAAGRFHTVRPLRRRLALLAVPMMLAAAVASASPASAATPGGDPRVPATAGRTTAELTTGWRFTKGDPAGARLPDFDDSSWSAVALPHTWNDIDGHDGVSGYYRGAGWYRRLVTAPATGVGHLEFDGANAVADVYVDGRPVASHKGGYSRFRAPLTGVRPGATAVVAVRVDNAPDPAVAPLSDDWVQYGGLYRGVRLVRTGDVHVDLLHDGAPGVYARTALRDGAADVSVETRVANDTGAARSVEVVVSVTDARGRPAAPVAASRIRLAAGAVNSVTRTVRIARPHLWQGRIDPYLYRIRVDVVRPGAARSSDTVVQPLGIRTVAVDSTSGFLLNGSPYRLYGVNMHQGREPEGFAVSRAQMARDLDVVREIGATSVRLVHYQHDAYVYDRADADGLLLWTEIPFMHKSSDDPAFIAGVRQQLRELVLQNFNHPSVAFWSIGNEVTFKEGPDPNHVLIELSALLRALDPSRVDAYATCCVADDDPSVGYTTATGYHRYEGWYFGTSDLFGLWADANHAAQPDKPFAVTEYGAGGSPALHAQDPPPSESPYLDPPYEELQTRFHDSHWRQIAQRPYLFASWAFVLFDFASDGRDEGGVQGLNNKGLITDDRTVRKDAFFYYKANWNPDPMLYLTERRFTVRPRTVADVTAFGNSGPVTLYVNGVSAGTRSPDAYHVVTWPGVRLAPGDNVVTAVSSAGGRRLTDTVHWSVDPQ